jgi:hypothetical protein
METLIVPHLYIRSWTGAPIDNKTSTELFCGQKAIPLLQRMSLLAALETRFPDPDTCLVGYCTNDPDAATFPRLASSALVLYSTNTPGAPTLNTLFIDIDHENHTPPPEGWVESILAKLSDDWTPSLNWYRTPNGMRLVFPLANPVEISLAGSFLEQAHEAFHAMGVPTDKGTCDWTRLFRAPRAGGKTYPMNLDALKAGRTLSWMPPTLTPASPTAVGHAVSRTLSDAIQHSAEVKVTRDALKLFAKAYPELSDQIYHKTLTTHIGDRHRLLLETALKLVTVYQTNDPLVPYRLLSAAAKSMGKEESEVFKICEWAASAFDGFRTVDKEERRTATQRAAKAMGVPGHEVARRLVVDLGSEQFVWDEGRERYSSGCSHQHQVLTAADQLCPTLLSDWYSSFAEIMRAHSTKARRLVYTYIPERGGFDSTTETMYVPVCRTDASLLPKFNADVQGWLEALFDKGESPYYESVMDWLAALPQLDMPVCALYIDGPPSIGKGLLAFGLARLWSRECRTVPYEELLEDFNETLTMSPLVYADEKVPHGKQQDSSVFRRMVGNSAFRINAKHRSPAVVEGYPRIIITANNSEALTFREDLDPNDINAIRLRLGYAKVSDAGQKYLIALAKSQGAPSARHMADRWRVDGVIAQHVLWLSQNREFTPGSRFLVEGWDSPLIRHLPTNIGSAGLLVDAIVSAILSGRYRESIRWFDGHIFLSNPSLAAEWEDLMPNERMPLSNSRMKAMRALSGGASRRLDIPTYSARRVQKMYWEIPAQTIAHAAEDRGLASASFILDACARVNDTSETHVTEEVTLSL